MSERGFEICPPVIERARKQALECFADPDIGVISILGAHFGVVTGIGRCRTAKHIAKAAMDSHLFDITIWVSLPQINDWSLRNVQSIITKSLEIDGDEYDDEEKVIALRIYESLEKQRFLLVFEDPPPAFIKLASLGVPHPSRRNASKVLIVTQESDVWKVMPTDRDIGLTLSSYQDDFINVVKEECADVADSLRFTCCHLTQASVLTFLKCFRLFGREGGSGEYIKYYWLGEGLIGGGNDEHMDFIALWKIGEHLLTEFERRYLIKSDDKGNYNLLLVDKPDVGLLLDSTRMYWIEEFKLKVLPELKGDIDWISFPKSRMERLGHTPPRCPKTSILVLHGCTQLKEEIPDDFFSHMQGLRVLDLSRCTTLSSLPTSLSHHLNLRVLNLANCKKFSIFPHPIQNLENLVLLDLSGTSLGDIPSSAFKHLGKLRLLNLSNNPHFSSLPSSLFSNLCNLQQLDLSNATSLIFLPSLYHCTSLKILILKDCSSLRNVVTHLCSLEASLESLDLSGCKSLEDISDISFGLILPNLRFLNLSRNTQLVHLSLRDHPSLEEVELEGVTSLEVLDLSGTKIRRFPHEICSKGTNLKCLYLLGTKHLHLIDWDKIEQPPKELLNWDECSSNEQNQQERHEDGVGRAFVSLRSSDIFHGNYYTTMAFFPHFSQFHVIISPCSSEGSKGKYVVFQREDFPYRDIYSNEAWFFSSHSSTPTQHFAHFMSTNRERRYLEINGGNTSSLKYVRPIIEHTQFLSLCNYKSDVHLTDLGLIHNLEACWIERCHGMKIVFYRGHMYSLKNVWVSNLAKLTTLCKGPFIGGSFGNLKHIRLEYCPKLVKVFSWVGTGWDGITLGNLEMLEIRFCVRLEAVFEEGTIIGGVKGNYLPKLHTLCLWELSSLKRISESPDLYLTGLKKVNVRGCPMLQKLPLHFADAVYQENDPKVREIKVE